jgi:hypothetical protein
MAVWSDAHINKIIKTTKAGAYRSLETFIGRLDGQHCIAAQIEVEHVRVLRSKVHSSPATHTDIHAHIRTT